MMVVDRIELRGLVRHVEDRNLAAAHQRTHLRGHQVVDRAHGVERHLGQRRVQRDDRPDFMRSSRSDGRARLRGPVEAGRARARRPRRRPSVRRVDELAEALQFLRIRQRCPPLAGVACRRPAPSVLPAPRAIPRASIDDHRAQVVESAVQLVQPHRGPLQAVRGADIEHEEAIDLDESSAASSRSSASRSAWRGFMPPLPQT